MRLLFLGPPGAGKGTQAVRVADELGLAHVSTGDMFRSLDPTTDVGARVNALMEAGELIPDSITIEMLDGGPGIPLNGKVDVVTCRHLHPVDVGDEAIVIADI